MEREYVDRRIDLIDYLIGIAVTITVVVVVVVVVVVSGKKVLASTSGVI